MFSSMFSHIDKLGKGLDVSWKRQEVISHNIANAETPGYKSRHVEFETVFRQALEGEAVPFETKTTRPGHIRVASANPLDIEPVVVSEDFHTMRMDENNVDVDAEMTELAENTIMYNQLVNKANSEFARLRIAITGSR